jgi:phage protein U
MFASKKEKVLTVTIINSPTEERWILQGRLGWPWVNQLRGDWRNARRTTETRGCIVDLNGVTFIDKIGKRMLRIMAIQGAQFATSDTGMRQVLQNLTKIDDGVSQTAPGGTPGHSDEAAAVSPPAAAVGQ